jgi:hypothetical protein
MDAEARAGRDAEIIRRYRAGESYAAIARALGCPYSTVANVIWTSGVADRMDERPQPGLSTAERADRHRRMRAMRAAGASTTAIALAFGVSTITARAVVRGVVPAPASPPPDADPGPYAREATMDHDLAARIVTLYQQGRPLDEIAAAVGKSHPYILEAVHRAGIPLRKHPWTPDEDALIQQGLGPAKIARITGRTYEAVRSRRDYLRKRAR